MNAGMETKLLEIRDAGTFIPMLCVNMNPTAYCGVTAEAQRYLLRRCGYPCDGKPNILITKVAGDGDRASNDPYYWGDRTRAAAHGYIIENWDKLSDGDVVDVEFILGESKRVKVSERFETHCPDPYVP